MTFTINGITYESNEKGNRFFKTIEATDKQGNALKVRVGEQVYRAALEQYEADRAAEEAFNKKHEEPKTEKKAPKKAPVAKPRKSKDIAFQMETIEGTITLTAKQVDFLNQLPLTSCWDEGLDSKVWCDCIAEEIGWNPMSVGAMISTLREKKLVEVRRADDRKGKPKYMAFTIVGQVVINKVGLK